MKERYIWITPDLRDELTALGGASRKIAEFKLELHISAYDIPKSVKGYRNEEEFNIEFDYIDSEPLGKSVGSEEGGILIVEGKHSGRLLRITIDLKKFQAHDAKCIVELEPKIIRAIENHSVEGNRDSFNAAKMVIEKNLESLVGSD